MPDKCIALIGAGRMGMALAKGWQTSSTPPHLILVDPAPSVAAETLAKQPNVLLNPASTVADIVVVAVKPQIFSQTISSIQPWIGPSTQVISIMAGVRLRTLQRAFSVDRIVRAMPNTPGAIGRGVSVFSVLQDTSATDIAEARDLLAPLGEVEGPVDEDWLSAVTALSGSGPAYVFLLAEAMAAAGVADGLPEDLADRLARATLAGSSALLAASDDTPAALREAVTSKGGTTQAALDILMSEQGMPSIVRNAMRAAARRERDLSEE